ncbi:unnamed protein product, partial [Symbiodinium sp. CCMP2456]
VCFERRANGRRPRLGRPPGSGSPEAKARERQGVSEAAASQQRVEGGRGARHRRAGGCPHLRDRGASATIGRTCRQGC